MNLWQLFKREIRQMFITDPRRAVFLFGASLAYLALFSILYNTHAIKAVPLIIFDENQTQFSRKLIQSFEDSERFYIINYATTQDEMENALHEKEAYAAVHVPKKFAQDAKNGRSSTLLLMVDGANIAVASAVTTAAQEIIASFSKETGTLLTEKTTGQLPMMAASRAGPVGFSLRVLNNPTQSYLYFFILGLAMAAIQQGIFLAVGASLLSEQQRSAEIGCAHPLSIIAVKLFTYWLSGTLAFFITIAAATHLFEIPGKAPFLGLLSLSSTFVFSAVALSAFLASICNTELTFNRVSIAYSVPAFILSGYTWPQEAMDTIGSIISYTFPLSYIANTLRDLMFAGYSPLLYRNSSILLLIGIIFAGLTTALNVRKLKKTSGTATVQPAKA